MEVRQAALSQTDTAALAEALSFTATAEGIETRKRIPLRRSGACQHTNRTAPDL